MTKKKENTAVAVLSVSDGIDAIKAQIKKLGTVLDTSYKTSGNLKGFPNNLQTETDKATLVMMYSSVQAKEKAYNEAQVSLKKDSIPLFKVDGAKAQDWFDDISLRFDVIDNKGKHEALKEMEREWKDLMDKDDKKALLMKKMERFAQTGELEGGV